MKPEYDFTNSERGKFFRPATQIRVPIYLDTDLQNDLAKRAALEKVPLDELVNSLLRDEMTAAKPIK
jgi:hypothetical protein